MKEYIGKIIQDGLIVAKVIGNDREKVLTEIRHYEMEYKKDGAVKVVFDGKELK